MANQSRSLTDNQTRLSCWVANPYLLQSRIQRIMLGWNRCTWRQCQSRALFVPAVASSMTFVGAACVIRASRPFAAAGSMLLPSRSLCSFSCSLFVTPHDFPSKRSLKGCAAYQLAPLEPQGPLIRLFSKALEQFSFLACDPFT